MDFNIVYLCKILYPNQIEAGNILFRQEDAESSIEIAYWNVPNIEQPSIEWLNAQLPLYENQWVLINLQQTTSVFIQNLLDTTAKSKQYTDSWALVGYKDSTVLAWAEEALAFIAWRDSVYQYAITIFNEIQAGTRPIPTLEEFEEGIPPMVWPNEI